MDHETMTLEESTDQSGEIDRPLITFALFGFNQEAFVARAIEAALAQTYSPLEIILSDDVSSDKTFEIMQEIAAQYEGPHSVRARQSPHNVGTLAHVLSVAREARGDIMVVAAGDDLSVPERVETIAREFDPLLSAAYSSDVIHVDANGNPFEKDRGAYADNPTADPLWITGATAAYDRHFLANLPMPSEKVLFEDVALLDLVALLGRKEHRSTACLVRYTAHEGNVFNKEPTAQDIEATERLNLVNAGRYDDAKRYVLEVAKGASEAKLDASKKAEIILDQQYFALLKNWPSPRRPLIDRLRLLYVGARKGRLGLALARCLPAGLFFSLKQRLSGLRSALKS